MFCTNDIFKGVQIEVSSKRISEKAMAPTPILLPGESQGWGSLVGCRLWGCTESDMTEVT